MEHTGIGYRGFRIKVICDPQVFDHGTIYINGRAQQTVPLRVAVERGQQIIDQRIAEVAGCLG